MRRDEVDVQTRMMGPWSRGAIRSRMLGVVLLVATCAGCDQFFSVCVRVSDCASGAAVEGAEVRLDLVEGASESETALETTAPDGMACVGLNEPSDARATLTVSAEGFAARTLAYDGIPDGVQEICLEP